MVGADGVLDRLGIESEDFATFTYLPLLRPMLERRERALTKTKKSDI